MGIYGPVIIVSGNPDYLRANQMAAQLGHLFLYFQNKFTLSNTVCYRLFDLSDLSDLSDHHDAMQPGNTHETDNLSDTCSSDDSTASTVSNEMQQ